MDVSEETKRNLRGVPMTESERDAFLREQGQGVLSLARDGHAYAIPVSFGYDGGDLYFILLRFGEDSKKLDFTETTETATFSTFEYDDEHHWRSINARGPIERVPEDESDDVDDIMFENAEFASLYPHGEPITDHPRFRLVPEETTGQKGQGHE